MSVSTPAPTPHRHRTPVTPAPADAARSSTWSLLMLAVFVLVYFVTGAFGEYVVLGWLGLPEGSLFLMAGGLAGWATEIAFALALVAPPVAGVWFAVRALRAGGRWPAWTGLVLNALLVLLVAYMFVDAIRMSYFAPLD
jgi:hypothetical protein